MAGNSDSGGSAQSAEGVTQVIEEKRFPRIRCAGCYCCIGPGYPETEVYLEYSTRRWVCGWHPREHLVRADDYIKIATAHEVASLTAPALERLLRQRTKELL